MSLSGSKSIVCAGAVGLLVVCLAGSAVGREEPPPMDEACVNDHGRMLSKKARAAIKAICIKADKDGVPMGVVTVRSLAPYGVRNLDSFVDDLFDEWDIDYDAANDAILLFVAHKEREIRIRMGDGYPDGSWKKAKNIMRRTVGPALRRNPSGAVRKGIGRLFTEVAKPHIRAKKRKDAAAKRKRGTVNFGD
jgi:uncharacterized protein